MKKADKILEHIFNPFKEKLEIQRCLKKIISLMPKNYNKYISSSYIKGETLYINVTHSALRNEIFYKRAMIFDIIKTIKKFGLCKNLNITQIKTIHKYSPTPKSSKEIKFFLKKSGEFKNLAKNTKIKNKFEEIRNLLKNPKLY